MNAPLYPRRIIREVVIDWLVKMELDLVPMPLLERMADDLLSEMGLTSIFELVLTERAMQVTKGFDADHDDGHVNGELNLASLEYARAALEQEHLGNTSEPSEWWPFEAKAWKPRKTPLGNLIVALAFLIAEAERIERAKAAPADLLGELAQWRRVKRPVCCPECGSQNLEDLRWDEQGLPDVTKGCNDCNWIETPEAIRDIVQGGTVKP